MERRPAHRPVTMAGPLRSVGLHRGEIPIDHRAEMILRQEILPASARCHDEGIRPDETELRVADRLGRDTLRGDAVGQVIAGDIDAHLVNPRVIPLLPLDGECEEWLTEPDGAPVPVPKMVREPRSHPELASGGLRNHRANRIPLGLIHEGMGKVVGISECMVAHRVAHTLRGAI